MTGPSPETTRTEPITARLRVANPVEIERILSEKWLDIAVLQPRVPSEHIEVPEGWHGAGARGDALVLFGDMLTTPIAGTVLDAEPFVDRLAQKGFTFEYEGRAVSAEMAAFNLGLPTTHSGEYGKPVFRAIRTRGGMPAVIEYYNGVRAPIVAEISRIGNLPRRAEKDNATYRALVADLVSPFIADDGQAQKNILGLRNSNIRDLHVDDCAAALSTVLGMMALQDMKIQNRLGHYDGVDVSIGTTHSALLALAAAELRKRPLVYRAGAPSFALAGEADGLNYMANVHPDMLEQGNFTSGDFGIIMSDGREQFMVPHTEHYGASSRGITHFYYNGGGPMRDMMYRRIRELAYDRTYKQTVNIHRAKRVDRGPDQWAVLYSFASRTY